MNPANSDTLTFEQALADLEAVLRRLEDGSTGLEESLAHYERGVELLKHCYGQLRQTEQRITLLMNLDEEGKPVTQPFEHSATVKLNRPDERPRRSPPRSDSSSAY